MGSRGPKSFAEMTTIRPTRSVIVDKTPMTAPKHLRPETRAWWKIVIENHELESHQLRTLQAAAESWDRKEQARQALAKNGLVYEDERGRVFARPEVAIERDARTSYLRALRELNLRVAPPAAGGLQYRGR